MILEQSKARRVRGDLNSKPLTRRFAATSPTRGEVKMLLPIVIMTTVLLSACNLAPPYQPPPMIIPPGYKETGTWLRAKPSQAELDRGCWWEMYQDPILNQLEMQVLPANQNLQAALARYDQARAAVQVAGAGYFPTIVGARNPGAIHSSDTIADVAPHRQYTDYSIGLNVVYEVDLWGQVRNSVLAAGALAQASAADMAALNSAYKLNSPVIIFLYAETTPCNPFLAPPSATIKKPYITSVSAIRVAFLPSAMWSQQKINWKRQKQ